jgi:hypothetical protein
MILADPPRIVLDFSTDAKPAAVASSKPAPPPAPKPEKSVVVQKPAPKVEPPKPEPVKPVIEATKPVERQAAVPAPEPAPKVQPRPKVPSPAPAQATRESVRKPVRVAEPSTPVPPPEPRTSRRPAPSERTERADAKPEPRSPAKAPARQSAATKRPSLDYTMLAVAAGGLVLVIGGVVFWRRRSQAGPVEVELDGDEALDEENPFSAWASGDDGEAAADELPREDTALFEETGEESKGTDMEQTELPGANAMSGQSTPPPIEDAGGSEEVMQLVRELERRVAAVESKLDEAVESRERLERQVAAQTEELRVQRAAIARTQRAVRNLTRTEEELPTEPALRDPDRPSPGGA